MRMDVAEVLRLANKISAVTGVSSAVMWDALWEPWWHQDSRQLKAAIGWSIPKWQLLLPGHRRRVEAWMDRLVLAYRP